jgi:uncharacterized membrane protein YoaK (UPF0700 family)
MTEDSSPAADEPWGLRLLPLLLSLVAGCVDVIGFLWHRVFVAHITGNLILVAARVVDGTSVGIAAILSVPVFVVMLGVAHSVAVRLEAAGIPSLRPLLAVQCLFLAGFLGMGLVAGTHGPADSGAAVTALLLGVSGLATQNALVLASIRNSPSTAAMTNNLTRFMYDISEMLFGSGGASSRNARHRAALTWPVITGFVAGAAAGAALYAAVGIGSLALPLGASLLALALPSSALRVPQQDPR